MTTTERQNVATRRKKEKIVLKSKMAVPKRDLIKTENSKAIRQSSRPQGRTRRHEKEKKSKPPHFHGPTSFLITPMQLEDYEGRRNDCHTKTKCYYKKE